MDKLTPPFPRPPEATPPMGRPQVEPIEILSLKLDKISLSVDTHRAEGNERGKRQDAHNSEVTTEIVDLKRRVSQLETGGVVSSAISDELQSASIRKGIQDHVDKRFAAQDRVSRGLCQALGVEYDKLADAPPGLTATQQIRLVPPPRATLTNVSKTQRASLVGQGLTLLIVLTQIIAYLLKN